jgi:hemerythrin-like domain-containing protein
MPKLLEELRQEHRGMHEVLGCLGRQIDKLESDEQPDFDVICAALDYFEGFPDQCHHPKEDLVLARLGERDPVSAWIVGDLRRDHEILAENLRVFAAAIRAVLLEAELPRDAIARWGRAFIDLQRRHIAMELSNFFPAAARALTPEDWRELAAAAPSGADPLRSDPVEAKYEALRRTILAWDGEDRPADQFRPTTSSPRAAGFCR